MQTYFRLSTKIRCIFNHCNFPFKFADISFSVVSAFILDIDECVIETHSCGPAQYCDNVQGGFRCHDDYDAMMTSENDYHDDEYQLHAAGTREPTSEPSNDEHQPTDGSHAPTCSPGYLFDPTTQSCNGNQ